MPSTWDRSAGAVSVVEWIATLSRRIAQIGDHENGVSLSLLFNASRYVRSYSDPADFGSWLTATQQTAARSQGVSLETLVPRLDLASAASSTGIALAGLSLVGAGLGEGGKLEINDGATMALPLVTLVWSAADAKDSIVSVPLYQDQRRSCQLLGVPVESTASSVELLQRGIAILS